MDGLFQSAEEARRERLRSRGATEVPDPSRPHWRLPDGWTVCEEEAFLWLERVQGQPPVAESDRPLPAAEAGVECLSEDIP